MKNTKMKSTHMFRDQVDMVSSWFGHWNECEQTVALYSLLRKVSSVQAKFLLQVIQQSLTSSPDVIPLERQANDPAYISSLCAESKADAVSCLLSCLPLLQAGNMDAKEQYLKIIPKILAHSLEKGCHIEESRQLLSYTLIHPAISADERTELKLWQHYLEECYAPIVPHQHWTNDANDTVPSYANNNGHQRAPPVSNGISIFSSPPVQPTSVGCNSLHQMSLASSDSRVLAQDPDTRATLAGSLTNVGAWTKGVGSDGLKTDENNFVNGIMLGHHKHLPLQATYSGPPAINPPTSGMCNNVHRKLTRSISDAHTMNSSPALIVSEWLKTQHETRPLSPQSSVTSSGSGSDTHPEECGLHDRNTFLEEGSGMREVPIWLKSLRLHKYASLFQQLAYDDMMSLTEEWLDSQGVTKGARHKIVLNIARLKERQNVLRAMEKDIMEGGNIKQALSEIKSMLLNTPIRSYTGKSDSEQTSVVSTNQNTASTDDIKSHGNNLEHVSVTSTLTEGDCTPEGDVPGQLTRVMGKLCTQLLVTVRPEDNCFAMYLQLLDKCLLHEAFTYEQKKKLSSWRQQTQKILHTLPQRCVMERQRASCRRKEPHGICPPGFNTPLAMNHLARTHRPLRGQKHLIMPPQQPTTGHPQIWAFGGSIHSVLGGVPGTAAPALYSSTANQQQDFPAASYPFELPVKQLVGRTQSAPNKSSPLTVAYTTRPDMTATEPDINARLDSLCLSMTEHALGSFDGPDRGSTF